MPRPTHPYIRTWEGWLYLGTVLDVFSRRVIGFSLAGHMRASLVCDALTMAVATRGGNVDGVIFHSDRGNTRRPSSGRSATPMA
jgi:transposase InsO family protein